MNYDRRLHAFRDLLHAWLQERKAGLSASLEDFLSTLAIIEVGSTWFDAKNLTRPPSGIRFHKHTIIMRTDIGKQSASFLDKLHLISSGVPWDLPRIRPLGPPSKSGMREGTGRERAGGFENHVMESYDNVRRSSSRATASSITEFGTGVSVSRELIRSERIGERIAYSRVGAHVDVPGDKRGLAL